jgi:hypothetical protein
VNATQHLEKADRNKDFLSTSLLNFVDRYPDWVSVVAFYSALHYVEAIFATHGLHYEHHEDRNRQVSLLLQEIENEYLNLYDLGRNSRYGSIGDIPSEDEARQAANIDLSEIEEFVKSRLTQT